MRQMIEEIRSTGAAIRLITDGDVAGVMHCAEPSITGIDMYMGSGGAPEGVLAAAALKCMGGQMFGKLLFRNDDERARARKAGITNFDRVYTRDDLVTADVIFAATGVTDGSLVAGIKRDARLYHRRNDADAVENRVSAADAVPQPDALSDGRSGQLPFSGLRKCNPWPILPMADVACLA